MVHQGVGARRVKAYLLPRCGATRERGGLRRIERKALTPQLIQQIGATDRGLQRVRPQRKSSRAALQVSGGLPGAGGEVSPLRAGGFGSIPRRGRRYLRG